LRHPCDYKRYRIYIGCIEFVHRKSIAYIISNRVYTVYLMSLNIESEFRGERYRVIRYIYIKIKSWINLDGFWLTKYTDRIVCIITQKLCYDTYLYNELKNTGKLEAYIYSLKWLEHGDKAHFKCIILYNETVLLCWLW